MFSWARSGFHGPEDALPAAATLLEVLDEYRGHVSSFMASPACEATMLVELRSREILVIWVATCLIHKACCQQHPITSRYGIGLDWLALEHLVLSNREAVDAALSVSACVKANTQLHKSVFTLVDGGAATFKMAEEFARHDPTLVDLLEVENAAATARVEAHWTEVKRKQEVVSDLRGQIRDTESRLSQIRARYNVAMSQRDRISTIPIERWHTHRGRHAYDEYVKADLQVKSIHEEFSRDKGLLTQLKSELSQVEKAPAPVTQPLPQGLELAHRWLFFLFMPPSFRLLPQATFLAQQALLPYPRSSVAEETVVNPYKTQVIDHYKQYQRGIYHTPTSTRTGKTGRVEVWTRIEVPQDIGAKHVDSFCSKSDGVWYPDSLALEMCWKGSGSQYDRIESLPTPFNPFANIGAIKIIQSTTERLQGTGKALEWCMPTYGTAKETDPTLGNCAVASQDLRGSLSKPSYLALCTMRMYPFGQFRRLCAALCQKSFPLDHPVVRTAVLQSLYQLGRVYATADGQVGLKWRAHWDAPGDVLTTLKLELDRLADELEETPREHDSVLLLGTIAAYLSAWHAPCILTTRRFARMVSLAADNEDVNIQEAALTGDDRVQQGLRERQSHLRKISLMCYASGPFDDEDMAADAAHMIKLMALINHGGIFMEEQSEESKRESTHLHMRCQNIMAMAVGALMGAVKSNLGCLTDVVRVVLPHTPKTLKWGNLRYRTTPSAFTASFWAEGADGHLYCINILDGSVLLDGSPPSRLPKDILAHSMYRRAFGDINFEVAKTSTGVLQTLKPVKGHMYNFSMVGGTVVVTEEVAGQGRHSSLELLDVGNVATAPCELWGAELPVRIRQLYSHWLCRTPSRATRVTLRSSATAACASPSTWRWPSLLSEHRAELTDELVLAQHSSLGLNILSKLEDSTFIHTYSQETTSLLWELPRYGLEFEQRDGTFLSRDYAGFRLADEQQLAHITSEDDHAVEGDVDYTLPKFEQYLVLERMHQEGNTFQAQQSDKMIIVPKGTVTLDRADKMVLPNVSVTVSKATNASLKVHRYEVHPRFGHLVASSILSRLQLAALYSATSSLLPEPRSRMSGAQLAMRLVRWSSKNRPLTEQERNHLDKVARCGGHLAPGLHLLCLELERSSSTQKHLHENNGVQDRPSSGSQPSKLQDPKIASLYLQQSKLEDYGGWCCNSRMLLQPAEAESAMG
eukprot:gene16369-22571_t